MTNIKTLCNEILAQLSSLGRAASSTMLPGLSETAIGQLTSGLPFSLPQPAIELYKWSEGANPLSTIGPEFFPGFGMDPLSEMVAMYCELSIASDFPRFQNSTMSWFPLFRSEGTDFYGIRFDDASDQSHPILYDDSEAAPFIRFVSLEALLETILLCYQSGAYYVNAQNVILMGVPIYSPAGELVRVDASKYLAIEASTNAKYSLKSP